MLQVTICVISKQLISNKVLTKMILIKKIFTIFAYNINNKTKTIIIENTFEFGRAEEDECFTDCIEEVKRI